MTKSVLLLLLLASLTTLTAGHGIINPVELIQRENAEIDLAASSISLKVWPRLLSHSGEWVEVSWNNVDWPNEDDWIGVFSPPLDDVYQINLKQQAPVKLQMASYSETHLTDGYGSLKFSLMNMRDQVIFGFFRGGLTNPILMSISSTVSFYNYNEPTQGHLALTGDPTEMILQWVSRDRLMPAVHWGEKSGDYKNMKTANTTTYGVEDMCGSPATDWGWRDPGQLHSVTLDNLTPGQTYYYIYGDFYGWSSEYSFRAAPVAGADVTTTVITYGDMGCGQIDDTLFLAEDIQPHSFDTTDLIQTMLDEIDFVLHIGDISYARGFSAVWDIFMDQIEPIAVRVPYMVCIGNHERNWFDTYPGIFDNDESGGECGTPHYMRFLMPRPGEDKAWFGFDYGLIHFVMMSTEHDFDIGTEQYQFLKEHLESVDRSITPWLVFTGHRPMYIASSDYNDHQVVAQNLRDNIEDLLYDYQVDIAMWAHHHSYQRTCAVYKKECTDGATIHTVIGMGGRELSTDLIPSENPDWIEVVDFYHYGYAKITADSSSLTWEFIRDEDNTAYDQFTLSRNVQSVHRKNRHFGGKNQHSSVNGRHSNVKDPHFEEMVEDFHSRHTPDDKAFEHHQDTNEL